MKKITSLFIMSLVFLTGIAQNNSLQFDDLDDYVRLGDNFEFSHTDSFSVEAWVKVGITDQQQIISRIGDETGTVR